MQPALGSIWYVPAASPGITYVPLRLVEASPIESSGLGEKAPTHIPRIGAPCPFRRRTVPVIVPSCISLTLIPRVTCPSRTRISRAPESFCPRGHQVEP